MFRRRSHPSAHGEAPDPGASGVDAPADAGSETVTVLQAGTVVSGTLRASGRVRVYGTVQGDVEVDGLLEVGPGGLIEASSLRAQALVVLGRVSADVDVSGSVEVWKGAVLDGDVRAASIDIESGATFRGRSLMCDESDAAVVSEAAAEAPTGATAAASEGPAADEGAGRERPGGV